MLRLEPYRMMVVGIHVRKFTIPYVVLKMIKIQLKYLEMSALWKYITHALKQVKELTMFRQSINLFKKTLFFTAYIRTDLNNCEEIDDAETLPNPEDFYFNH
ncbi:hypothetical protein ACKWTF_013366 [Chironomus riparius]